MSKAYLLLLALLTIAVLGIGGFAYFRSQSGQTTAPSYSTPTTTRSTPSQPAAPSQPSQTPAQNQISLTVISPTNGQQVSTATLVVKGKTVPNADVAVNDKDIKADASGNFSTTISLDEGDNEILVTASDANGNSSEWSGTVTYTPAQ